MGRRPTTKPPVAPTGDRSIQQSGLGGPCSGGRGLDCFCHSPRVGPTHQQRGCPHFPPLFSLTLIPGPEIPRERLMATSSVSRKPQQATQRKQGVGQ